MSGFRVFIGFDEREKLAYDVFEYSIRKHSSIPLEIVPLNQDLLRWAGVYSRPVDTQASTAFSITRFLVPYLCNYSGPALFADCDMLMTVDIKELLALYNYDKYAVQVVKHNYIPKSSEKMDNAAPNTNYPKKNWSSFILFHCGHKENRNLNLNVINNAAPSYLHRFSWLKEEHIGELNKEWNFLVGEYDKPNNLPKNLHYTNGLNFLFDGKPGKINPMNSDYDDMWESYRKEMELSNL